MGYMRHHAIIVTSWESSHIREAHAEAVRVFSPPPIDGFSMHPMVGELVASPVNSYESFVIYPDGSKEGWMPSDEGNKRRAEFLKWMRAGSLYLDWVEVQYGDDERITKVTNHSDA